MVYSARTVLRIRFVALVVLRSAVVVLLLYKLLPALADLADATTPASGSQSPISAFWQNMAPAAPAVVFALVAFMMDRRFVRWLAPMPRWECPACVYELAGGATAKCPECGAGLAPDASGTTT